MILSLVAGVQAGLHANVVPEPTLENPVYMGGPGTGMVNLTMRQLPPQRPSAILEQGVGRTPGITDWERQDHKINDNPDWYLGIGALFQPADLSGLALESVEGGPGGGPYVSTPIPISTQLALEYIQNREAQNSPGSSSQRTVPMPPALTETQRAVLP